MANKAYQRIYTKLDAITKATVTLKASGASNDELAFVGDRLGQVVKTKNDSVTLQVFAGTEGIPTNAEVTFLGEPPTLTVGEQLSGRFFDAYGHPIDGGPEIEGEKRQIGGPSVNPYKRREPSELIPTGIAGIDLNNTIVSGQKIPFFADPDQPYNQVMADVALRADVDKIILAGMGLSNDDYLFFRHSFENAGVMDKIICFINTTENPPVERLLVPDMALTAAEYFAVDKNEKVLVLLTDMTLYADALSIVSNRMDQIPSKDSMPNTGYITEGQLYLRADADSGKVIIDPFRSLSRLKQRVQNKKTREDHSQVMNAGVRLYADAQNAKTKLENGFDLSDYDHRCLAYAKEYATRLLSIDVNISIEEMLDTAWELFGKYFTKAETGIKQGFIDKYWKGKE